MKKENSLKNQKKVNIKFLMIGYFFAILSYILLNYFLPFYLKEKGLNILEIGTLLTTGLALGSLIVGVLFSKLQRKIKLKSGLNISAFFYFVTSFIFVVIPNYIGVIVSNLLGGIAKVTFKVSTDVTMQHNSSREEHRKISAINLIVDSLAVVFGLVISLILINSIGFLNALWIFSIFALIALYFFSKVHDRTRFKSKKEQILPKISMNLKLILASEILYWLGLASSFSLVITFLVTDYFSGSIGWIAVLFIVLYASITLTTLFTRKILDKLDLFKSSIFGMILLLFSALIIIFSRNLYFVGLGMILEGIGAGIWVPSKTALYWGLTPSGSREIVSGYLSGLRTFASTIGPLFGGVLVAYLGILAPFYFKMIIALVSIVLYVYLMARQDR